MIKKADKEAVQRLQSLRSILLHSIKPPLRHDTTASSLMSSPDSPTLLLSNSPQQGCSIAIKPMLTQFDETVQIRVYGHGQNAKVTLQGLVRSQWRKKEVVFVSHGHFYTDQQGNLDLNTDPALDGTYTGVDPAGLFWSMRPLPGHPQDARLVIRDVTKPLVVTIAVFSGHVTPDDDTVAMTSPAKLLCVTRVQRRILAPGVKRIEIREGRIRGTLFLPPGGGTHPGVIDMFGAAGGNMETRAALLAGHGFAALSLAFIAFEDLPKRMMDVQFDYFEEATAWLTKHPAVRAGGLGVVGVSSGACNAMLMAIHCPQVKAVVEINGPPFQIVNDFLRQGKVFQRAVVTDINKVEERQKEGFITRDCYVITDEDYFP